MLVKIDFIFAVLVVAVNAINRLRKSLHVFPHVEILSQNNTNTTPLNQFPVYQNRKYVPKSAIFGISQYYQLTDWQNYILYMTINGMLLKACFLIGLTTSSFADVSRRCYTDVSRRCYTDFSRRWYAELSREGLNQASALYAPDPISISFTSTEICYLSA